ncbi:MAG: tetratricopeptide repeat protein [Candidatus Hermodarchaeota archaeon]
MSVSETLEYATQLLNRGQFDKALHELNTLEKVTKLTMDDQLAYLHLKSVLLIKLGRYKTALRFAEQLSQKSQQLKKPLQEIDSLIVISEILRRLGTLDKSVSIIEQAEQQIKTVKLEQSVELTQRKASLLYHKGLIYWSKSELNQALEVLERSLALRKEIGNKSEIAQSIDAIGWIHQRKGNWSQALKGYQQCLELYEELGNTLGIAHSLEHIGWIYSRKGNLDQALKYTKRALALLKEINYEEGIAWSLNNMSVIYRQKGDLDQALECYQQTFVLREKIKDKFLIAWSLNATGNIYRLKGDLDQALEYLEQALTLFKEIGNPQDIAISLNNISDIYRQKGDLDQALKFLERNLALFEEMGNNFYISETLFHLICIASGKISLEKTRKYLQRLQEINSQEENKIINQRYRISEALVLKTSTRLRNKLKATELLEQVTEEETIDHELTVTALVNLCHLLLMELRMTGEQEVLEDVQTQVTRLLNIAQQQNSSWLLAETYLLKSKLALLELDLESAQEFLIQALHTAEKKGLKRLIRDILLEKNAFREQIDKWKLLIERNAPLSERLELAQLEDLIIKMTRKRAISTEKDTLEYAKEAKRFVKVWEEKDKK